MKKLSMFLIAVIIASSFAGCNSGKSLLSVANSLDSLSADDISMIILTNQPIGVGPEYSYPTTSNISDTEFFEEFIELVQKTTVKREYAARAGGSRLDIVIKLKNGNEKTLKINQGKVDSKYLIKNQSEWNVIYSKVKSSNYIDIVRTNGYHDGVVYPIVTKVKSTTELNGYYETYKDLYSLDSGTHSFVSATESLTDDYFENSFVFFVIVETGSGSNRYKIKSVETDETTTNVSIQLIPPNGDGTCDMAEWHIIMGFNKTMQGNIFNFSVTAQ